MSLDSVIQEVRAERVRQVDDLGFDPEHDERVGVHGLAWLVAMRSVALTSQSVVISDPTATREKLLEAAAIAIAAIQYIDRN